MEVISDLSFSFAHLLILKAVIETGIAEIINSRFCKPEELSLLLDTEYEGTKRILKALKAIGIVEERDGKYSIKPEYKRYFNKESPFYIGYFINHSTNLIKRWEKLADVLKKEKTERLETQNLHILARALFPLNIEQAERLALCLSKNFKVILDVGCGSCVWSIPFAKRKAKVFALDLDEVIENAAIPVIKALNLQERFTFIKGDLFQIDWQKGYDMIIWGHICHIFSPEKLKVMFSKAKESLNKQGSLVIIDFIKEQDKSFPFIFDINMLLATKEGRTYEKEEFISMAENHHLDFIKEILLDEKKNTKALVFKKG